MGSEHSLREALAALCLGGGWSYAVAWRADHREPRLLVVEESYYEEHARGAAEKMLNHIHIVGEGIIGGVVLTKKSQWIYSDTFSISLNCIDLDMIQGFTWWQHQFLDGIKTIAVVPLPWIGAVQFGSMQRITESFEFAEKVKHVIEKLKFSSEEAIIYNQNSASKFIPVEMLQTIASNIHYTTRNEPGLPSQMRQNCFPLSSLGDLNNNSIDFSQFELSDNFLGMSSQLGSSTSASIPPEQLLLPDNDLLESMITELSANAFAHDWWDDATLPSDTNSNFSMPNLGDSKPFITSEPSLEQLLGTLISNSESKPSGSQTKNQISYTSDNSNSNNSSSIMQGSSREVALDGTNGKLLLVDDSCSINNAKKHEEGLKVVKKRARPGESTRPRPKDRQQIQDRVKELREIVPNSAKCSIDALLDRTIKHMLFLQSVNKYAEKVKQEEEPKMIGEESGVVLKDNSTSGSSGGGATWAYEVAGQTMVCPIIVEDLTPPGQMLVEMLCEERGFFLEIADIIRGFGLTILKGVMELRDRKIWARFLVEANRDVTRMDIFLSLVQLLQQTSTIRSSDQLAAVIEKGPQALKYYHQSQICS
ncbi:transcription factor-like protein [Rhynchospora pubera]|uniref:Transcription factor-like protein n=1 Tax=Rhynchospora pubera TaxID=906938 RepID=A0AAV8BW78_9POAL|nr:transcription factor-like protein [Rhynchospora pubera]